MRNPHKSGTPKLGRLVFVGLPVAFVALALAVFVALAPAPERGFDSPSAEAARPKVRVLGLIYHDFGLGAATVTLEKDPGKAHFQPGPDSNHGPVVLNDGDTLFVEVDSGDNNLGSSTRLAISGGGLIKIHTSCSKPLEVGFFYGADGDETAEDVSEFGGGGFNAGFEVIELILTSNEPGGDCVAATATPTPTSTPTETITPTTTPTTPPEGEITICKNTKPEDTGTVFEFDTDIPGMTDIALRDGECDSQGGLDQGDYEVTENLFGLPGWRLEDIECDGTSSGNIDVDLGNATVRIHLEQGEDVECTFFNRRKETPNTPVAPKTCADYAIGDVNGPTAKPWEERSINAIDAAIILQFNAGHIESVPCPKNADVNEDGRIDATDALIIIQFTAKFIFHLPV